MAGNAQDASFIDDLCNNPPVRNYSFHLIDVSADTCDVAAHKLSCFINSACHAVDGKNTVIPSLAHTGRVIENYIIRKSSSRKIKEASAVDILDGRTLLATNIGNTWRNHKTRGYDGLVVLAALPTNVASGQDRAVELVRRLNGMFENYDRPRLIVPETRGTTAAPDMDIGLVYFAYRFQEESKPVTDGIQDQLSRNQNRKHCDTCKCISQQPINHCATCVCNRGAEGGVNMGGGAKNDEDTDKVEEGGEGTVKVEEGGEDTVRGEAGGEDLVEGEEGGEGTVTGEEGGEGTGSLGVGPDDVSEVTSNLNVMKLK